MTAKSPPEPPKEEISREPSPKDSPLWLGFMRRFHLDRVCEMPPAFEAARIPQPALTAGGILLLLIALPMLMGWIGGFSPAVVLGFIISILVLQGLAPPVGIGLGLHPLLLLPIMTSVAAGVIIGIFRVCDLFSGRSERVARWIGKVRGTLDRYPGWCTYGEFMLIPIMWIPGLGLYGTPVVAWILHWRGSRSILLMLTGWLIACLAVLLTAEGILSLIGGAIRAA
jgi:uncharacterized membrane protein